VKPQLCIEPIAISFPIDKWVTYIRVLCSLFLANLGLTSGRGANPDFVFTTFAGAAGQTGTADGIGSAARFKEPNNLTVDGAGNIYVADSANHTIRKITPDGAVTTLAGSPGNSGSADGIGSAARFNFPRGVAVDQAGIVYVADTGNCTIRKITAQGEVSTLAGTPAPPDGGGHADGIGAAAGFQFPWGVAVNSSGTVYVADSLNNLIRKITPTGVVTTLAGSVAWGLTDGAGTTARFYNPSGITVDANGNLYVADTNNSRVRKVTADGVVTTLPGEFGSFAGVAVDPTGNVYITARGEVMQLSPSGATFEMGGFMQTGSADGPANVVRFNNPISVALDGAGNLYVADFYNGTIRKGTPVAITWPTPPSLAEGTPLSDAQLNATANVEGTFAYSPAAGTYLGIGSQKLTVTFTPVGGASYTTTTAEVFVTVTARKPEITWPQPAPIDYGTLLTNTQLNARANVPGTISYSEQYGALLTAGTHTLRATLTPAETSIYPSVSAEVSLVVNPVAVIPIQIKSQPASQTVLNGASVVFSFSVTGSPPPRYYWQESRDGGATWDSISNSSQYSGTETATLSISNVSSSMDGFLYRCSALTVGSGEWSQTASLHVGTSIAYLGGYFGSFANGGSWAMYIGTPSKFIGYLPGRKSAIVETFTINPDGTFSFPCHELVQGGPGPGRLTLTGTISAPDPAHRVVSAQLTEINEGLTGAFPTSGALTNLSGDFFTATALGVDQGTLYIIVGYSGDFQAVVVTPNLVDGAHGTLDPSGSQSVVTSERRRLAVTINPNAHSVNATLSQATAATAPSSGVARRVSGAGQTAAIQFAGLGQSVISTSRFVNIATRAYCSTGNGVTIGGFVVSGSVPKRVLIRAIGPTLGSQGIPAGEVLQDPSVEVHDANNGNVIIGSNDNWVDNANAADITTTGATIGAMALDKNDTKSAALLTTLAPGVYNFVVKGKGTGSGTVLLEVYDADPVSNGDRFVNIATRAYASTGTGVAIGGFVISGNAPKHLLVRAVGPTLVKLGLGASEVLADPMIELHDAAQANAIIASNDDWGADVNASAIQTTAARVGAIPIDSSDAKSSALLVTLQPGVYSFVARGSNSTSGVVLVEVYDAD
jgi:sugar lactone lactonase YvrE